MSLLSTHERIARAQANQLDRVNGRDNGVIAQLRDENARLQAEVERLREQLRAVNSGVGVYVNGRLTYTVDQVRQMWNYKAVSTVTRKLKHIPNVVMPDGSYRIYADTLVKPSRQKRGPNKKKSR